MSNGACSLAAAEHDPLIAATLIFGDHHMDFHRPPAPPCALGICKKCGPPGDGTRICRPKVSQPVHGTKRPFGSRSPVRLRVLQLNHTQDTCQWCKTPHPVPAGYQGQATCKDCASLVSMVFDRGYIGSLSKDDETWLWHMCVEGYWNDGPRCAQQPLMAGIFNRNSHVGVQVEGRPNCG